MEKRSCLRGQGLWDKKPTMRRLPPLCTNVCSPKESSYPMTSCSIERHGEPLLKNFLTDAEEYVPAFAVRQLKRKPNHFNDYQHYVDCCGYRHR